MRALDAPWRATVLTYSRAAGLILAAGVVVFAATLVFAGLRSASFEREQGRQHARSFIAKVRACRRAPSHPSWNACELKVQDAE